jgi:predicted TIM-barrel fold metal-dependent hydrolase
MAELGRQPRAAKRLILAHPDRVLFGTDTFPVVASEWALWFRFLETDDECFSYSLQQPPPQGRWTVSALDLPADILAKVYADNARRLIPGLRGATAFLHP